MAQPDKNDDFQDWRIIQSFGDDNSSDEELVTSVQFDDTGNQLAVGDKAGRICIFQCAAANDRPLVELKFYAEFQSHEPEFDCLKSLEIDENINMIKWSKSTNNANFLLATNDKTIKLWKIREKKIWRTEENNNEDNNAIRHGIHIPKLKLFQTVTTVSNKRQYSNAHGYLINSISLNSDGETFVSTDDLRINLWNLNYSNTCFNFMDIKPRNLEELTEVITTAEFHPTDCNILCYGSSRGSLRVCDTRQSALIDSHYKLFHVEVARTEKSFFTEIVSAISSLEFSNDGRHILTRDYLSVKVWDLAMEREPVAIVPIHPYLQNHFCGLYENDCIFDKFAVAAAGDGRFVTGSYHNRFTMHNVNNDKTLTLECMRDPPRIPVPEDETPEVDQMDFGKKALHLAWHPRLDCIAVAGLNKLYIYQRGRRVSDD